jgi:DNA-binding NtrC family response regulator
MAVQKNRAEELPTSPFERTSGPRTSAYDLTVLHGPDRGLVVRLDGNLPARVLVGQSPSCYIRLRDARVSRRHLALDLTGDRLRIADLDSTNGTFVNGVAVVEAFLCGGEAICLGDTTLRVDPAPDAAPIALSAATSFGRVLGASLEMRRLYPICERIAAADVPVLIEGETGTGKEVLAEALHDASSRSGGPFVVFDCTAVPPNLVESELFGHERGAFTGATARRVGVFEQAHKGTLLIDEIGDLDPSLQPKLLRALERREVRRVGGDWVKVDVRVIAATRRDLDRDVQLGAFRDDLFYRVAVSRIELPPLRMRRGDVGTLAREFWRELGGEDEIPYEIVQRFERYAWPGNVRELRNAVARHLALGDVSEPRAPSAPNELVDTVDQILALELPFPRARDRMLAEFEKRYVERVLAAHGGVVARAASASGIARRYFNLIRARLR